MPSADRSAAEASADRTRSAPNSDPSGSRASVTPSVKSTSASPAPRRTWAPLDRTSWKNPSSVPDAATGSAPPPARTTYGCGCPAHDDLADDLPAVAPQGGPGERAELVARRVLEHRLVHGLHPRARRLLGARRDAHRVPDERRGRGGLDALSGHVADDEHALVPGIEQVEEVAADVGRARGRAMEGGELEAGPVRKRAREEIALERGRDAMLLGVELAVLERERDAPGDELEDRDVPGVLCPRRPRGEREASVVALAVGDRDEQRRREAGLLEPRGILRARFGPGDLQRAALRDAHPRGMVVRQRPLALRQLVQALAVRDDAAQMERPVRPAQVDEPDVRDLLDQQVQDLLDPRLDGVRAIEQAPDLGEPAQRALVPVLVRRVVEHADGRDDLVALVADRRGAHAHDGPGPVVALELVLLARHHLAVAQRAHVRPVGLAPTGCRRRGVPDGRGTRTARPRRRTRAAGSPPPAGCARASRPRCRGSSPPTASGRRPSAATGARRPGAP